MTLINRQVEAELFEVRETVTTNGDRPQGKKKRATQLQASSQSDRI